MPVCYFDVATCAVSESVMVAMRIPLSRPGCRHNASFRGMMRRADPSAVNRPSVFQ